MAPPSRRRLSVYLAKGKRADGDAVQIVAAFLEVFLIFKCTRTRATPSHLFALPPSTFRLRGIVLPQTRVRYNWYLIVPRTRIAALRKYFRRISIRSSCIHLHHLLITVLQISCQQLLNLASRSVTEVIRRRDFEYNGSVMVKFQPHRIFLPTVFVGLRGTLLNVPTRSTQHKH